ncbi:hydrogenase maturation protease [Actinoplanes solisilvae]|uniref:hydrogenase maturation protease n=1 Tax=Actinoplanes solisilvae TaxID=2486853 RepID=UPI000FDCA7CA|nr:hydrogenase maturation protease [Actinoplanes solisilvae]
MNVLVAGVGNVFLGDDGFGPEVARRLAASELPPGVRVTDYGIRGLHLAFDLLEGYDRLVLIDALPAGDGPPGETVVLEIVAQPANTQPANAQPANAQTANAQTANAQTASAFDAHGMDPATVLAQVSRLGGTLPPSYVVGCRAVSVAEGIGLSPQVEAAIPAAVAAVRALLVPAGRT